MMVASVRGTWDSTLAVAVTRGNHGFHICFDDKINFMSRLIDSSLLKAVARLSWTLCRWVPTLT